MFVTDTTALNSEGWPVLYLDPHGDEHGDHRGRSFRVIASELWSVENNLSLANMDFHEFADHTDPDGVYRGEIAGARHDTTRNAPDTTTPQAQAKADDDRLAAFHTLINQVATSRPELQRNMARWLAHRTARIAGPAATAWAQPALDALDAGQPLPAPFHSRQEAITAAHRDLAVTETHPDRSGRPDHEAKAPGATLSLVGVLLNSAESDPSMAVLGALTAPQHANQRPETELHDELRARFLT